MSNSAINTIESAIDAGKHLAGVEPRVLVQADPNAPTRSVLLGLSTTAGGGSQVSVLTDAMAALAKLAPGPQRRAGSARLTDEDSFVGYLLRWGGPQTVVYADTTALGFTAVLDDHPAGTFETAWREHRASYACPRSAAWLAWTAIDGRPQSQRQLADFIEARLEDLVAPTDAEGKRAAGPMPLEILSIARALTIKTKGTYRCEIDPGSGDRILELKTETDTGSTVIPRAFAIAIQVFEAGVRYQVEVRIRVETEEGVPQFTLVMHRRKEIELDAFGEVRAKIGKETARPVLSGAP